MRLFFSEKLGNPGDILTLDHKNARHLFKTLRARVGEIFELINGQGAHAEAEVLPNEQLKIKTCHTEAPPARKIHLAVAVPRKQKMDQLLRQCTELGVSTIVPIYSERSVSIPEISEDDERYQTLLIESCKQSRNYFMPKLLNSEKLNDFLNAHDWQKEAGFLGHPYPAKTALPPPKAPVDFWWIVGPEGGFTEAETQMMLDLGIQPVSLSPYILRVETAAVLGCGYLTRKILD